MTRFIITLLTGMLFFPGFGWASGTEGNESSPSWSERLSRGSFLEKVTISGTIEAEAGYLSDYDGAKSSDVDLTLIEIGIDVALNDFVSGFALLQWENDEDGVVIDEGGIVLGNLDERGYSLTVGKLYLPFGTYETGLISDPLTLELGETREGAAVISVQRNGFYGAVYAFNSAVGDDEDDDMIDAFGATVGFAHEADGYAFDLSAGWISNLTSSGGFSAYLEDNGFDVVDNYVSGAAVSALVTVGDFSLIGEYIAALDDDYLDSEDSKPQAWNLEAGYGFELYERATTLTVAWQGTKEAAFLELPKERFATAVSYELYDGLTFSLEGSVSKDYSVADGGTGKHAKAAIAQLALVF